MLQTRSLAGLVVVAGLALTGCSDSRADQESKSPDEVMALAKTTLDETSGLTLRLSTDGLPDGVSGIAGAEGVVTDAPAFDGTLSAVLSGNTFEVPVIAVDGKTFAELPLVPGWTDIDPGDYGAPEPAELVSPDKGFSAMLAATTDLEAGDSVRGGPDNDEILTEYTGQVPGESMKAIIPVASGSSFDAVYLVTDAGELRQAELTGIFYQDSSEMTYTVDFEDYGTTREIAAP